MPAVANCDNLKYEFEAIRGPEMIPGMKLGIKKSHRGYVGYIRGTQAMGIHEYDYRIILYDSDGNKIMPVKKSDSIESLKDELANLSLLLGLSIT